MDEQTTMNQNSSSGTVWYIVAAVAVIAALGFWYFASHGPATSPTTAGNPDDNTAAAINAEVNQLPDDSDLGADQSASAQAVSGF
jgi:hypothetical protein